MIILKSTFSIIFYSLIVTICQLDLFFYEYFDIGFITWFSHIKLLLFFLILTVDSKLIAILTRKNFFGSDRANKLGTILVLLVIVAISYKAISSYFPHAYYLQETGNIDLDDRTFGFQAIIFLMGSIIFRFIHKYFTPSYFKSKIVIGRSLATASILYLSYLIFSTNYYAFTLIFLQANSYSVFNMPNFEPPIKQSEITTSSKAANNNYIVFTYLESLGATFSVIAIGFALLLISQILGSFIEFISSLTN
jgi:hypothetical protein